MDKIKNAIINERRCFHLVITSPFSFLAGCGNIDECLFFVQKDGNVLAFCRMVSPSEITADDIFTFTESKFDEYIQNGNVELL